MKLVTLVKKKFFNKAFVIYFSVGLFITVLSSMGSTIAGVFLHENPLALFWTNLIAVNGVLFILKYVLFLRFGFVSERKLRK